MTSREPADIERLRAALAASTGEPGSTLDAGRIFDALHGEMSAEERQAVVDATVGDAEAAEAWRLAMELSPGPSTAALVPAPASSSTWRWMGLAASVLLAVGLAWQFAPWRTVGEPVYRSTSGRNIASLLPVDTPLSRQSPVLRWTAVDGARYLVRVFTADLQPIAEASDLAVAEYPLPAEVVDRLPSGSVVLWQVQADVRGEASIVSPTFTTRLQ